MLYYIIYYIKLYYIIIYIIIFLYYYIFNYIIVLIYYINILYYIYIYILYVLYIFVFFNFVEKTYPNVSFLFTATPFFCCSFSTKFISEHWSNHSFHGLICLWQDHEEIERFSICQFKLKDIIDVFCEENLVKEPFCYEPIISTTIEVLRVGSTWWRDKTYCDCGWCKWLGNVSYQKI